MQIIDFITKCRGHLYNQFNSPIDSAFDLRQIDSIGNRIYWNSNKFDTKVITSFVESRVGWKTGLTINVQKSFLGKTRQI